MKSEQSIAFKEWASIVNALAQGKQILILRKGGIREDSGEFQVEHDEFFLFPTYEHQNKSDLKVEAHPVLDFSLNGRPDPNKIPIQYYVKTEQVMNLTDEAELARLRDFHIWSDEAVAKRFHYGRQKGLYVITCRIFKLPKPHVISNTPEYAGCKSWVTLTEKISTLGAKPILSDFQFKDQSEAIESSLIKS